MKVMKKLAFILIIALAAAHVSAGCIEALDACYAGGGSETLCNAVYTACIG